MLSQEALCPLGRVLAPHGTPSSLLPLAVKLSIAGQVGNGNAGALGRLRTEGGGPALNTMTMNHTARAPGSDINIFWKLSVYSEPPMPTHLLPSLHRPTPPPSVFLGCSARVNSGLHGDKGDVSEG